ncbi:MAG: S41 family peptidase [Pseudomonadota bacterium]
MVMKVKSAGLLGLGMAAGLALSLQLSAAAQVAPGAPAAASAPLPLDELRQLTEVYGIIKSDYVEPVEEKKLLTQAMAGMVTSLDPHSVYLDKKAFKEMKDSMQGRSVGLGIEVSMEEGNVKIVSPIEDSPAHKAGLRSGDIIVRIDNTPLKGLSLDEAIRKMRGDVKSTVTLTIMRKGEDMPWVVPLVRAAFRVPSVKGKLVEPGYGWIRISQFQELTVEEMAKKIGELYAQEPQLKGLVLDLRNDPGGLLPGAIGVSAAFLPEGKEIVSTLGQRRDANASYYGRRADYAGRRGGDPLARLPAAVKSVPLVVLVNAGSASASEIVAGALQDYKRATIMGTQTFGKGSVQSLLQLTEDTAVKLTTALYYTPEGRKIQAKGIVPDLMVNETADGDGLNSLRVREADLEKHLGDARDPAVRRDNAAQQALAQSRTRKVLDFGSRDDFQLAQAINHFKGLPVTLSSAAAAPERAPQSGAPKPEPVIPEITPGDKK